MDTNKFTIIYIIYINDGTRVDSTNGYNNYSQCYLLPKEVRSLVRWAEEGDSAVSHD